MIKASTAALPGSRGLAIISPGRRAPARPSLGFGEKKRVNQGCSSFIEARAPAKHVVTVPVAAIVCSL